MVNSIALSVVRGRIKISFGISTDLKNMNLILLKTVFKMVKCDDTPVVKISDSPGKSICEDPEFLSYLRKVLI